MRTLFAAALASLSLTGCTAGGAPAATPTPTPIVSRSRDVKKELNALIEKSDKIYHVGCRDEEKAACRDTTRVCPSDPAKAGEVALAAAKKGPVAIEWEEPRTTWEKNEGVDAQYWFVKPDGSGTHYWRVPAPDDNELAVDCGNGVYCGWHKKDHPAGTLLADGRLTLTPRDAKEPIADLGFCQPPPPQPDY